MAETFYNDTFTDRIIGSLYALLYFTERKHIIGISIAGLFKNLPWLLALLAWPFGLGPAWIISGIVLAVVIRIIYWRGKRVGYIRFIPEENQQLPPDSESIDDNPNSATATLMRMQRPNLVVSPPRAVRPVLPDIGVRTQGRRLPGPRCRPRPRVFSGRSGDIQPNTGAGDGPPPSCRYRP